jgi:hypothetical protein
MGLGSQEVPVWRWGYSPQAFLIASTGAKRIPPTRPSRATGAALPTSQDARLSLPTLRWRELDSNFRFRREGEAVPTRHMATIRANLQDVPEPVSPMKPALLQAHSPAETGTVSISQAARRGLYPFTGRALSRHHVRLRRDHFFHPRHGGEARTPTHSRTHGARPGDAKDKGVKLGRKPTHQQKEARARIAPGRDAAQRCTKLQGQSANNLAAWLLTATRHRESGRYQSAEHHTLRAPCLPQEIPVLSPLSPPRARTGLRASEGL